MASRRSTCGGCAWAFSTSAFCRRTRSRTAPTSACTRRSSAGRFVRHAPPPRPAARLQPLPPGVQPRAAPSTRRAHAGALYRSSPRALHRRPTRARYPGHFLVKRVTNAGTVRFKTRLLYLSTRCGNTASASKRSTTASGRLLLSRLLGRIDERKALVKGQLGVTHVPGKLCYLCSRLVVTR